MMNCHHFLIIDCCKPFTNTNKIRIVSTRAQKLKIKEISLMRFGNDAISPQCVLARILTRLSCLLAKHHFVALEVDGWLDLPRLVLSLIFGSWSKTYRKLLTTYCMLIHANLLRPYLPTFDRLSSSLSALTKTINYQPELLLVV